ncbi:MAG: prephenate dehydratase [Anaerolineae bacterium]
MSNPPLRVAFQGERGAFSEAAAIAHFGADIEPVPCEEFDDVFRCVAEGACERGMVPIENSLGGSIHRNYDLLLRHDLAIIGEENLRVVHNLLALPGVTLEDVRRVYSHPQGLAQCEGTLERLGLERVPMYDTAGSAKYVREQGIRDGAAIASRRAAEVYGLAILMESIEDDPENYTRFLALAREAPLPPPLDAPAKTSLVFAASNVPGSLFKALSVFALRDIDLTKIESRPLKGKPFEYYFYLDFAGSLADPRCQKALDHLAEYASYLRILGSYPKAAARE